MAGRSLAYRVALLKLRYPHAHVTIYKLRKLYRIKKIKKKVVKFLKVPMKNRYPQIQQDIIELTEDLNSAHIQGFKIIQIDEMMVTKRTLPSHCWSNAHSNTTMDLSWIDTKPVAVIGAVSREKGIELIMTFPKSINIVKFKVFLEELRALNPFENMILMMDNLGLHRSNHTIERMNELGFRYAWCPRYSP